MQWGKIGWLAVHVLLLVPYAGNALQDGAPMIHFEANGRRGRARLLLRMHQFFSAEAQWSQNARRHFFMISDICPRVFEAISGHTRWVWTFQLATFDAVTFTSTTQLRRCSVVEQDALRYRDGSRGVCASSCSAVPSGAWVQTRCGCSLQPPMRLFSCACRLQCGKY